MSHVTYSYKPGLGNVASFQASGKPFVSGGISCGPEDGAHVQIDFPTVTRWFSVSNSDADDNNLMVAFSLNGLTKTNNYYECTEGDTVFEVKCGSIILSGSANCSVFAGLTGIPTETIDLNWSGSSGVG